MSQVPISLSSPPLLTTRTSLAFHRTGLPPRWLLVLATLLAAALLLRWVAIPQVVLAPEEAYYWMYSEHLDLSYFDHPPMIAWTIRLGTLLFGDTEFGVRVAGTTLMFATSALMFQFGRMWFDARSGLFAAVALHALPLYFGAGFLATMDAPLLFFWSLCMVGVSHALKGSAWGWYLAGLALGGALLSKYSGIFLAVGTLSAVCLHRPWRRHLRTIHPYLAVGLALLVFSPVVIWNAQNDWASFRFQFMDRFAGSSFDPRFVANFMVYQVAALTPLLLVAVAGVAVWLARRPRRLLRPAWLLAVCFSAPLLAVLTYKALRYQVHVNWTLPAFLGLLPAVARWLSIRVRASTPLHRRRWSGGLLWTTAICLAVNIVLIGYLLVLQPRLGWMSAFGPWRELAIRVERIEDALEAQSPGEPLVIACGKYRLASVLAFYRSPMERCVIATRHTTSQWVLGRSGLGYPYWADASLWNAPVNIYVDDDDATTMLAEAKASFESVDFVDEVPHPNGRARYTIAVCRGRIRPPEGSPGFATSRDP